MNHYEINTETLLIVPIEKGKSKVYELNGEYVVNMSSLAIIKNSCLFFGSSYEGRSEGTKALIGIEMKVPIVIEDSRNIIFFPTSSCIHKNSVWISHQNLINYVKINEFSTVLYFRDNKSVRVDVKYNLVDNQVTRCVKLEVLLAKRRKFLTNECIVFED